MRTRAPHTDAAYAEKAVVQGEPSRGRQQRKDNKVAYEDDHREREDRLEAKEIFGTGHCKLTVHLDEERGK